MSDGRAERSHGTPGGFTQIGYLYTPMALFSLFLGLSKPTFAYLQSLGLTPNAVDAIRFMLLAVGMIWSLFLGARILGSRWRGWRRAVALVPHLCAMALIVTAWVPVLSH